MIEEDLIDVTKYVRHDWDQEWTDRKSLEQFVPMTVKDPQLTRHHYAPPPKGPTSR